MRQSGIASKKEKKLQKLHITVIHSFSGELKILYSQISTKLDTTKYWFVLVQL